MTVQLMIRKKNYILLGILTQNIITAFIMGCTFLLNFWILIIMICLLAGMKTESDYLQKVIKIKERV